MGIGEGRLGIYWRVQNGGRLIERRGQSPINPQSPFLNPQSIRNPPSPIRNSPSPPLLRLKSCQPARPTSGGPVNRLPVSLARACALWCAVSLAGVSVFARQPPPRPPAAPASPANDLDAFMEKVLARRDVNRRTLDQYVLDETESFEILGPGRWPLHRTRRDYTWYVRDGMHVRSPVRFNGVKVGDEARDKLRDELDSARARAAGTQGQEREREGEREAVGRDRDHQRGHPDLHRRASGHRAALRVGSLFHGLQVRAGQLLPGRTGTARRPAGAEGRVLPHEDVRRLRRREERAGAEREE